MVESIGKVMAEWKGTIPNMRRYSRFAGFIMAFGERHQRMEILSQLIAHKDQFNNKDIQPLSLGLQAACYFSRKTNSKPHPYYVDLSIYLQQYTLWSLSTRPSIRETTFLLTYVQLWNRILPWYAYSPL